MAANQNYYNLRFVCRRSRLSANGQHVHTQAVPLRAIGGRPPWFRGLVLVSASRIGRIRGAIRGVDHERTARGRLTVVLRLFRRSDRIEHHLRIGWLCQRLCHFVALIALVWIVAAKFGQFQSDCMTCKLLICSCEPTDARRD